MEELLRISNIHKIFNEGEPNEVYALKEVDLNFFPGEFTLIIGHNGSGKSTLLNILDGRIEQTIGKVQIQNMSINDLKVYQRSKYFYRLYQETWNGVIPMASIRENLSFAMKRNSRLSLFKKLVNGNSEKIFKDTLEEFNPMLSESMGKKVFDLSPGERQAIILSLLKLQINSRPQILLADEPTASLDPEMTEKSIRTLNELALRGWLCLIVTHDERLINYHKGRLIKFKKGIVEYDFKSQ